MNEHANISYRNICSIFVHTKIETISKKNLAVFLLSSSSSSPFYLYGIVHKGIKIFFLTKRKSQDSIKMWYWWWSKKRGTETLDWFSVVKPKTRHHQWNLRRKQEMGADGVHVTLQRHRLHIRMLLNAWHDRKPFQLHLVNVILQINVA